MLFVIEIFKQFPGTLYNYSNLIPLIFTRCIVLEPAIGFHPCVITHTRSIIHVLEIVLNRVWVPVANVEFHSLPVTGCSLTKLFPLFPNWCMCVCIVQSFTQSRRGENHLLNGIVYNIIYVGKYKPDSVFQRFLWTRKKTSLVVTT